MPELPEVEVTRRRLEPYLVGRSILQVRTTKPSYFFLTPPGRLAQRLKGATATKLERTGKYLLLHLSTEDRLLLHLGMTGQLFTSLAHSPRLLRKTAVAALPPERQTTFKPDPHTHLQLEFEDGAPNVYFRDVRKFGKVKLLANGQRDARLDKLGVDALSVSGPHLYQKSRTRSVPIKSLLLDQSVLAGVGNIYADESLHAARVSPSRPSKRLTKTQCMAIASEVRRVLMRSIETGGSSISDYVAPDGSDGGFQDERQVYARNGAPCYRCQTPIVRLTIGQRSSHYCPSCQK